MEDYQKRVIEERNELVLKINLLENTIPLRINEDENSENMHDQLFVMKKYRDILNRRIGTFIK